MKNQTISINKNSLIHFVGISGIGFSGLALILHQLGYKVQGSDLTENDNSRRLKLLGINFFLQHSEANLISKNVTHLVISSIISDTNPEVIYAKSHNIPIYSKADIIQFLSQNRILISVTGTHGKTTTTAIFESILSSINAQIFDNQLKIICFVGGIMQSINTNAYVNDTLLNVRKNKAPISSSSPKSKFFEQIKQIPEIILVEADESDDTFVDIKPNLCVITNADRDHIDFYGVGEAGFVNLLQRFENLLSINPLFYLNFNCKILCLEDKNLSQIYNQIKTNTTTKLITYGFTKTAQVYGYNIQYHKDHTIFDVKINSKYINFKFVNQIKTYLTGSHNVLNILGCIAANVFFIERILEQFNIANIDFENAEQAILQGIQNFSGTKRRFNLLHKDKNFDVIEDYGHHPAKIKATLDGARQRYNKIFLALEIHKYSRLFDLFQDFVETLKEVDYLVLTPIHSIAGDNKLQDFDCTKLQNEINKFRIHLSHQSNIQLSHLSHQLHTQFPCKFSAKFPCQQIFSINDDSINKLMNYFQDFSKIESKKESQITKKNIKNTTYNTNQNLTQIHYAIDNDKTLSKKNAIIFMGAGSKITKIAKAFIDKLNAPYISNN